MNHKRNWTRRSRTNAAIRDIPVRFSRGATGFEVKIKSSARNRIPGLETTLVQRAFDLNTRADGINVNDMSALLLRKRSVLALVTLPESILVGRRFEALLKTRKKRC